MTHRQADTDQGRARRDAEAAARRAAEARRVRVATYTTEYARERHAEGLSEAEALDGVRALHRGRPWALPEHQLCAIVRGVYWPREVPDPDPPGDLRDEVRRCVAGLGAEIAELVEHHVHRALSARQGRTAP